MKFHIYRDAKNEWRWRLRASNGKIIAESGEGYKRKVGVKNAILCLTSYASVAPIVYDDQRPVLAPIRRTSDV